MKCLVNSHSNSKEKIENKIGIFTDFPNSYLGLKNSDWSFGFDYSTIENFAFNYGRILFSNIYADWSYYQREKITLKQYNVKLIYIKEHFNGVKNKDSVDPILAFDMCYKMYRHPEMNLIFLVSGDIDYLAVIKRIKMIKKAMKVFIIGEKSSVSHHYEEEEEIDKIIHYRDIVNIL